LPAHVNGYFTFGSFNNHLKINDLVLDLWAQVLRNTPHAHLVLKFPGARDHGVRDSMLHRLKARGLEADRIKICGPTAHDDHLNLMGQVDMLLDTYPFNGFRTTLEGIWMGVPTLTLSGPQRVSRTGLAIMKQLGLDSAFVTYTPQAFVERACDYARQLDALACIRAVLRDTLLSSSVCDPTGYARSLEGAFRFMWQQWCDRQSVQVCRQ
jgi:predicted O-linked N-acetylglucosamine transferase (SPINDLY family)